MRGVVNSGDGLPVHYEVDGTGEPALVFVHGWSCDRTYWRHQVPHFADRYRVVTLDLAGHGESGVGRRTWTMEAFGEDVVAVADELGLQEMVLIGHSMGGDVIVDAAKRLDDRVVGLVWVDVYRSLGHIRSRPEIEAFIAPFRAGFVDTTRDFVRRSLMPGADPDLVEWIALDMSAAPSGIALGAMEHAVSNHAAILATLPELAAPVVAINPDHLPTDAESLGRYGVSAVIMPGVAHFPMMEDPETFNRLLGETVARVATRRGSR